MSRNWTFGRKVGAGFAVTLALSVVMAVIAIYGLRTVVVGKDPDRRRAAASLAR
jgi:CHASE3 domain sensor protein